MELDQKKGDGVALGGGTMVNPREGGKRFGEREYKCYRNNRRSTVSWRE